MRKATCHLLFFLVIASSPAFAQHDHQDKKPEAGAHLQHIQACRKETVYIDSLPSPLIMDGIGHADWKIVTRSAVTQQFFNQGISMLHCFWDFEAYRAFKEAIRNDSTAVMAYWGMLYTVGGNENPEFKKDKDRAVEKLKELKDSATEKEKLYAEAMLKLNEDPENGSKEFDRKLELAIFKYPEDIDAKLFLALNKMSGYSEEMHPNEGTMYAGYILRDVLKKYPENAAAHHYWIHQMENCCPEQALESAIKLTQLAGKSGHMVHMPGHIYYRMGDYKKAYESFTASLRVDSVYMNEQHIPEVDNWNYIHNINYLLGNCVEDGRYTEGLFFAEKLKKMYVAKDRKKAYQGRAFFGQGIMAPGLMELRFGFYDKAVLRFSEITDKDSIYLKSAMNFKDAYILFAKGMSAVRRNKLAEAKDFSNQLDGYLWRNEHQQDKEELISKFPQNTLNIASLELQGLIKDMEGNYAGAVSLLTEANNRELKLGYSEPPSYPRPVLLNLAGVHSKAGKQELAIDCYEKLLKQYPNSSKALLGMVNVYTLKGDKEKALEYKNKLKEVVQYGDKNLFVIK